MGENRPWAGDSLIFFSPLNSTKCALGVALSALRVRTWRSTDSQRCLLFLRGEDGVSDNPGEQRLQ